MSGVHLADICEAIAGLQIDGVTVRDLDNIPTEVTARMTPILYPLPEQIVSSLNITRQSFGDLGNGAKKDVTYTLTYRLCFAELGEGRGLFEKTPRFVDTIVEVVNTLTENDALSGMINGEPSIGGQLVVNDPSGRLFHGCDISIDVLDFYEVT